jgi:ABC-type branched-subunit amino acid transport system ATPase component
MSLLRIEGLKKAFGGLLAVDDVSLEIQAGEMSAIIGPNGAGKTTFFNLVTGYLSKDSGRVFLRGMTSADSLPRRSVTRGLGGLSRFPTSSPDLRPLIMFRLPS